MKSLRGEILLAQSEIAVGGEIRTRASLGMAHIIEMAFAMGRRGFHPMKSLRDEILLTQGEIAVGGEITFLVTLSVSRKVSFF